MKKPPQLKKRLTHRLKISKGHLDKVIRMVEEDEYCIDVINQSKAVQSALREVDNLLLENHLKTCVVDYVKKGKQETSIKEIMKIFRSRS